jgi:hypothetical protein
VGAREFNARLAFQAKTAPKLAFRRSLMVTTRTGRFAFAAANHKTGRNNRLLLEPVYDTLQTEVSWQTINGRGPLVAGHALAAPGVTERCAGDEPWSARRLEQLLLLSAMHA